MKPSVKNRANGNSQHLPAREVKKQINLQWNSSLFFQFGLVISLLTMLWIVQQDWQVMARTAMAPPVSKGIEEPTMKIYRVEPVPTKKVSQRRSVAKVQKTPVRSIGNLLAKANTSPVIESTFPAATRRLGKEMQLIACPAPIKREDTNLLQVEEVPIFPGCEQFDSREERLQCFQDQMQRYIGKNFRMDSFVDRYAGEQKRIFVQFTIDEAGEIATIQAASMGAEDLGHEAVRVIQSLPALVPGKQNGVPVKVSYRLPIILNMQY